ncbi:uncharacterized protein LOC130725057 [Lotus japonicus]|uniref:uncharacterized protein LOC130725057 n=1 Tax=Lotus japonicus TaxID=34305 RepID=UPI0025832F0E|nr:uncharacterized protein LOC130725057 [Lotus japonicus]
MGRAEKRRAVIDALMKLKPELALLQETKLDSTRIKTLESFAKAVRMESVFIPTTGSVGGLITLWNSAIFTMESVSKNDRFIGLLVKSLKDSLLLFIVNVYGPNVDSERYGFFNLLTEALNVNNCCTILGRDFNAILNEGERTGTQGGVETCFSEFVAGSNLIDLPLQNDKCTWYSSRLGGIWSRLDRWLVCEEAINKFEGICQSVENWELSDHRPIILTLGAINFGPKPFLFYNHWLLDKEFEQLVSQWWCSATVVGWSAYVLQQKLKGLKSVIKEWRGYAGSANREKISALETELQVTMDRLSLEGADITLRQKRLCILDGLWQEFRKEETRWRQKARVKWIREGDRNTSYFHSTCKIRMAKKQISHLVVGGAAVEEPNMIKETIFNHFQNFFTRDNRQRPKIRCTNLPKLSHEKMHGEASKRPNATFIALIPKHNNPSAVTDFRPISLIGSVYKLVFKVLASRLQGVAPLLVSENQFAFTHGRQISDCILIANEVVDFLKKREGGGFLLKLDFAKAYDNVEWGFLFDILKEMNFGERWINWIRTCVSTATLSILVNGSSTSFFDMEKGLRQGDPLSPLLFNLCANGLSCMLNQLLGEFLFSGVRIGTGLALNHLQFADDTLLFCENDENQIDLLCNALLSFLFASGLKVNLQKTLLIGCNVEASEVERIAGIYGWNIGQLPLLYLGAPLGGNPRRISFWEPMLDKLRRKRRTWNSKFISLSGRLTLMKAALCSVPLFLMAVFKAPIKVIGEVEKILHSFLWGKEENGRKITWIPWSLICKSHEHGGLGLGFIGRKNKALLLKWAWRFGVEHKSLWRRLLIAKYALDPRLLFFHVAMVDAKNWSILMQDIVNILYEDSLVAKGLKEGLIVNIGDGSNTRFWEDPWVDIMPLRNRFPRLFAMSSNKLSMVAEVGIIVQGKWTWDLAFRRNFFDWELEIHSTFINLINNHFPSRESRDHICWCFESSGLFSVKGLCKWIEDKVNEGEHWAIPSQVKKIVPPKVGLLFWQGCYNKIACKQNLLSRGVSLEDNGNCSLCSQAPETVDHLFLHCLLSWNMWSDILKREGVAWVPPNSLVDLAKQWDFLCVNSDPILWKLIPYSLVWSLWVGRNDLVFRDKVFNREEVWDMHVMRIGWWVKAKWKDCPYNTEQFNANFCNIRMKMSAVSVRTTTWQPPTLGTLKFNVDGASQGNPGPSGLGGVLRDHQNRVFGYFSINSGFGWAFEAEVRAILKALQFCQEFMVYEVYIESDSTAAVGWINSKLNRPWKLLNELNQIDFLLELTKCSKVSHIYREANETADSLAKVGCNRSNSLWWCANSLRA